MRLIDADELKKTINFVYNCDYIGSKSKEGIASDIIDAIDNAPTVEPTFKVFKSICCEDCDFRKLSEKFVDTFVDLMTKNDIASVEQLSEILKGGTEC